MNQRHSPLPRRVIGWLLGFVMLFTGLHAAAQQDPPGRIGRLNYQQGTVSFSPAGDDNWYQADPNRPLTTGDRVWTDRNSRAEIYIGSSAVRLDEQTAVTISELDDDTVRLVATQGDLQVRVRDDLAGQRFEIDTANLATVIDAPGDYRIDTDPGAGTTRVAVAAGSVTLFGENGESMPLGARQQVAVSGRNLAPDNGASPRGSNEFDRWVAERDRLDDQSISARYVSRDVVGYQQLDAYGDWRSDPTYGDVWYPRGVDTGWAPYQNGQWVDVAPWGWTWIDAAPWGFAATHYGRWARIGPRWGWVPGRPHSRPVYSPALVGFVGGAAGANLAVNGGRQGVGWFPLAPGEAWRPGYRTSQRYIDQANRAAIGRRMPSHNVEFANRQMPGAVTVVPADAFGRGPIARRDFVRVPQDRLVSAPVNMGAPIPLRGEQRGGHFGRQVAPPPAAIQAAQQQQLQQALQIHQAQQNQRQQTEMQQRATARGMDAQVQQMQQAQRQQFEAQQRGAAQAVQAQQFQQTQRQQQEAQRQQQDAQRQQHEVQRAAAQAQQVQQAQRQQVEVQQAQRQQMEAQQRAAAQAAQAQQVQQATQRQQQEAQQRAAAQAMQAQQAQQAQRQQVEAQQRAAAQAAQAQQFQQVQRQQQEAQQRVAQEQARQAQRQQMEAQRQQQDAQQRAAQMQAQQAQQLQRQQMEMQQRAAQAQAQQMQQLQQQQQQQAAMRAQQQQAQQAVHAQQQQAVRQAQEARQRGRQGQDQGQPDRP